MPLLSVNRLNTLNGTSTVELNEFVIYRSPYSEDHPVTTRVFLEEFSEFLESAVFCTNHLVIEGDPNIHVDIAEDADAIRLRDLLESTGLEQHVTVSTHTGRHTLDLIITRQSVAFEIPTPLTDLFSDHFPVHCKLKIDKAPPKKSQILFRKLKSINVDSLREELVESDLCKNSQSYDLNDLVRCYNNTLLFAIDRHAPVITKTVYCSLVHPRG